MEHAYRLTVGEMIPARHGSGLGVLVRAGEVSNSGSEDLNVEEGCGASPQSVGAYDACCPPSWGSGEAVRRWKITKRVLTTLTPPLLNMKRLGRLPERLLERMGDDLWEVRFDGRVVASQPTRTAALSAARGLAIAAAVRGERSKILAPTQAGMTVELH